MRALLVLGGPRLAKGPLVESLQACAAAGWQADVVAWRVLDDEVRTAVHATGGEVVLVLGPGQGPRTTPRAAAGESAGGPTKTGPRVVRAVRWRWRLLSKALETRLPSTGLPAKVLTKVSRRVLPPSAGYSRRVFADVDAVRLASECDVAVAVDRDAAFTVWRLARRRSDLTAVSGVTALPRLLAG